jgi:hypothetical protein
MRRIQIDLNRRNASGQTPARYAGLAPALGEAVIAYEPEDGVCVDAAVAHVDPYRSVVLLAVDWESIREDGPNVWARISTSRGTVGERSIPQYGPVWYRRSDQLGSDGSHVGSFERRGTPVPA